MFEVQNLTELTNSQLEAAIELGEGLHSVNILRIREQSVTKSILVMGVDGCIHTLPTEVRYCVVFEDDMEEDGELDADFFVEVTTDGIVGRF